MRVHPQLTDIPTPKKLSQKGYQLLEELEGFKAYPYLDSANVPTIGFGTIRYPDGRKVTMNDYGPITKEQGRKYKEHDLKRFVNAVNEELPDINQNQFDALVLFAYNIGVTGFKNSTLLRKAKLNPEDPSIKNEFLRWVKAGGKFVKGLENRRLKESKLYYS